ncbi:cytochrome b/b6 domain-containing protein [Phormidium tenue FACHB-886]|nr:cytochrome b/b6 domain-containing protein [Phormidium tenue FACHB-886]
MQQPSQGSAEQLLEVNFMRLITTDGQPKLRSNAFKHLMLLHWMMASCFLLLYGTGIFVSRPFNILLLSQLIPFLHQSFGILVMMLLVARIFLLLRLIQQRYMKRLPRPTYCWLRSFILHIILYLFMLIIPTSGLLLRNFRGMNTTFFGAFVSPLFPKNEYLIEVAKSTHFWSSYLLLVFVALHLMDQWKLIQAKWRRLCSVLQHRLMR